MEPTKYPFVQRSRRPAAPLRHKDYFDTLKVTVADAEGVRKRAAEKQINLRWGSYAGI